MNNSGIYCIENIENGMMYIGKGKNLNSRMFSHHIGCKYIENSINKHGNNEFIRYVIEYCEPEDMIYWEQYYIREWNTKVPNGYNLTDGGDGSLGRILSDETKEKIRISNLGDKTSRYGKTASNETKEKLRTANSGIRNPRYGKIVSKETRERLKIANSGKIRSSEAKENIRKGKLGKKSPLASSKYIGVYSRKYKAKVYWIAGFKHNKKYICVGRYKTELEAAIAHNEYIIKHNIDRPLNFLEK